MNVSQGFDIEKANLLLSSKDTGKFSPKYRNLGNIVPKSTSWRFIRDQSSDNQNNRETAS